MKRAIKAISVIIVTIGFFIIAGTAGASDLNTIEIGTALLNSAIGLTIITGGVMLAGIGGKYGE